VPLIGTDIDVSIIGGVAVVTTERLFRNAQPRVKARQTYETALDAAKTAVLHEECSGHSHGLGRSCAARKEHRNQDGLGDAADGRR
jgi:hypothetical protein